LFPKTYFFDVQVKCTYVSLVHQGEARSDEQDRKEDEVPTKEEREDQDGEQGQESAQDHISYSR
jgi:hypothetical protein